MRSRIRPENGRKRGGCVKRSTTTTTTKLAFLLFWTTMLQGGHCTTSTLLVAFYPVNKISQQNGHDVRRRSILLKHGGSGANNNVPTFLSAQKNARNTNKRNNKGSADGTTASSSGAAAAGGFGGGASRQRPSKTSTSFAAPARGTATTTTTSSSLSSLSSFGTGAKALRKAANNYDEIRKRDGLTASRDVYVRSPLDDKNPNLFWFVGKIARQLPPTPPATATATATATDADATVPASTSAATADDESDDECCITCTPFFMEAALFQKRLILDYSKMELRPQNFGGKKTSSALELWLAPADSEMNVATNKVSLCRVVRSAALDADSTTAMAAPVCSMTTVGYNPEIYLGDELIHGGLRVERDENGHPTKAAFDVNESL